MPIGKMTRVFLLLQLLLLLAAAGCLTQMDETSKDMDVWKAACMTILALLALSGGAFARLFAKGAASGQTGTMPADAVDEGEKLPTAAPEVPLPAEEAVAADSSPVQVAPTEAPIPTEAPPEPESPKRSPKANDGYGHTVLVTDDNDINREILKELLEQVGVRVVEAGNGQEAVDILREWDITLVIMDVEMPVMDGLEATRQIRGMGYTPRDMPILAMTGNTDTGARMDGMGLGMNEYLTKPVDPKILYEVLDRWLPGGLAAKRAGTPGASDGGSASVPRDIINQDAGLAAIGGNRKLYDSLLTRFAVHYGQGLSEMRDLLDKGEFAVASRLAHTIKGVAANLGMRRLTELTKTMEASLPEVPPDETLLADYERAMSDVLDHIKSLNLTTRIAVPGSGELSPEQRGELLVFLRSVARRVETDWGTVQSELESHMASVDRTPYAEGMDQLMASVNDFDLAGINRQIPELCRRLEEAA
ncbi:MAG: response regulator [Desulfovibrio sp.]|jgi:CheY-like chemotaxis protein/HPt (histidine-containing phosphotransfer) domain-containing protein|nr:response regulator [Desulfovibrio sp.]